MRLMCEGRILFEEVERRYGIRFAERFAPELAALDRDLATVDDHQLIATSLGAQLIRNVCRVFDRHTAAGAAGSPTI
jgi:oxygen-independent coproporphyrinogen-3 oxidase